MQFVGVIGYGDAMNHDSYSDDYLRDILMGVKTIAVVGASPRPHRPSHGVMRYLQGQGYRAIPVNPFAAGNTIHGERCYAGLAEITEKIDMVSLSLEMKPATTAKSNGNGNGHAAGSEGWFRYDAWLCGYPADRVSESAKAL